MYERKYQTMFEKETSSDLMVTACPSFTINGPETPLDEPERTSQTIERLLSENIHIVKSGRSIVESTLDKKRSFFRCLLITEATLEVLRTNPDVLTPHIPKTISLPFTSFKKTVFTIDCLPGQSFALLDLCAIVDSNDTLKYLESKKEQLEQTILLSVQFPFYYQQLVHSPGLDSPKLVAKLCEGCLKWAKHLYKRQLPKDYFEEVHRFFLANDSDFKHMRTPDHLTRLTRSHYVMRKRLSHSVNDRRLHVRVMPSRIQFPYGLKNVISIVVCLKKLYKNEQFDHRHIIQACKRCLSSLVGVPRSYYTYRYPHDTSISYHIECEKANGALFSKEELFALKKDLSGELLASIERVMSRIDIPFNEEEMLRNMILLLDQITTTKDPPHLLLQFQEQTVNTLNFQVSIVRAISAKHEELASPPDISSPVCHSTLLKSYIIEKFKRTHHKQGLMYLVQCSKEAHLRKDRSIDFHKARETVLECIEHVFGPVRDLNGGLLTQQHRLLESVKPLLSEQELKHSSIIEDLFRSVFPSIMKNFLNSGQILQIFRMYLSMKERCSCSPHDSFQIEETPKALCIGFIRPENLSKEEIHKVKEEVAIRENNLAVFHVTAEQQQFCFTICMSGSEITRNACAKFLQDLLQEKQSASIESNLKLCLQRLSGLLDPRIISHKPSGMVIKLLYEGLMRLDNSGTPQPSIAKEVSLSNNGLTYTFNLRNTYWSNGQSVTAQDFVYAWKKVLDPSLETQLAFLLYPILNARAIKNGTLPIDLLGVHALSDQTLEIHLEKPTPNFLERTCLWIYSPLLRDIDITKPGWAFCQDKTYICNGPFTIKKRKYDGRLYLSKNELYWNRSSVNLNGIDISVVENSDQALKLFTQNQIDVLGEPFSEVPVNCIREQHPHAHSIDSYGTYCLQINTQTKLLQSSKIRQALSLAINRKKLVETVLLGNGRPASSIIHSHLLSSEYASEDTYNPLIAQRLFEEGLKDLSLTKIPRKALSMNVSEKESEIKLAQAIAEMWKETFNIKTVIHTGTQSDLFDKTSNHSFDIWAMHWTPWLQDPLHTLEVLGDPTNPHNYSTWNNLECQCIIKQAQATLGDEYRQLLVREAEKIFMREMPFIAVCESRQYYLQKPQLNNVLRHPTGNVDYVSARLMPPRRTPGG